MWPIIPLPGVELTAREAEVIVVQGAGPAQTTAVPRRPLHERLAAAAAELGIAHVPADLAENHDHYVIVQYKLVEEPDAE